MQIKKMDDLSEFLRTDSENIQVVVCTNDWSRICRNLKRNFGEYTERHQKVDFALADLDEFQELRRIHSVASVPTWLFFKKSVFQGEMTGDCAFLLDRKLKNVSEKLIPEP